MDSAKDAGMVEAVARAAQVFIDEAARQMGAASEGLDDIPANERTQFLACIAAVAALIEAQVIERCAGAVREAYREGWFVNAIPPDEHEAGAEYVHGCEEVDWQASAAIRALSPAGDAGGGEK